MGSGNGRSTHSTALLRAGIRKSGTCANDESGSISTRTSIGTDRRSGVKGSAGMSENVGGDMRGVDVLGSFFRVKQGCAETFKRSCRRAALGQA